MIYTILLFVFGMLSLVDLMCITFSGLHAMMRTNVKLELSDSLSEIPPFSTVFLSLMFPNFSVSVETQKPPQ